MATTADIRNNLVIEFNGGLWKVVEFLHVKPGKGNAFIRTKLKNIPGGQVIDHTFRSGERIQEVRLETRNMTFLYHDGQMYHFMDAENYEQIAVEASLIGEAKNFIKENDTIKMLFRDSTPVDLELPPHVILTVTHTEPWVKGDTATGAMKPAELETGLKVQVPLFVETGDRVKVDTRTGAYLERVRD